MRIAAVTCIAPCSTRNKSEGLPRRARHGAAKSSSAAVSATVLARIVFPKRTFGTVGRTFGPNDGTVAATRDDEKATMSARELEFSAQSSWIRDHLDKAIAAQRARRGRVKFLTTSWMSALRVSPKNHEIMENECNKSSVSLRVN